MIRNFTGIDSLYKAPEHPELHLQVVEHLVETLVEKIVEKIPKQ